MPNQKWRSFARLCTFSLPDELLAFAVPRGTDNDGNIIESEKLWRERVQAWREKFALCFVMLGANVGFLGLGGFIFLLKCGKSKTEEETNSKWYDWDGIKNSVKDSINHENSTCRALNMTMLTIMLIVVAILAVQCLCSLIYLLRFGRTICKAKRGGECQSARVIVTIPCYNEGRFELEKTIDSVKNESYPKENKLLLFISDGNKKGTSSDGPNYATTPVILSHLLGYKKNADDTMYSCDSTGYVTDENGEKNPIGNRAKLYHGTTADGLNYMVIEKCGLASNADDVGNRGKRDSQILLLQLLNRVMHNHMLRQYQNGRDDFKDLNELETALDGALREMGFPLTSASESGSEQVKYLMAVDADTRLSKDSITQMVYSMETQPKTLALCGETKVDNKDDSWVTKMQVFEYYTNHGLKKAFESVFGTVTCLPGCFTMYRLFDARDTSQPPVTLFACEAVYKEYARNDATIETLHEKNLYKLGEDRMLTTLLLKKWNRMNLKYVPEAHCYTIVPDSLEVLLSQRRRWINSTFHNMIYLLSVNLGGLCCFSMKFILILDMIGTLILPSSLLYLLMMLWNTIWNHNSVSTYTLLVLGFSVFVQVIGPLLRFKIKYLWYAFVFYLVGVPLFYFVLPLYSFWKMDDFSWGTTRVTTDDSNSSTTSDELDEEQGSGGGGAVVDSNKASSTDTSEEGGGDSFEAEESNKASTDKVSEDEELGCVKAEEPKASLAEALGESTSEISVAAVNVNKVGSGSTGCLGEEEERMDSFLYASLDSSANQLNDGAEAEEQREIEILTVEKNPSGARAVLQRGGSILKGKIAVAFLEASRD